MVHFPQHRPTDTSSYTPAVAAGVLIPFPVLIRPRRVLFAQVHADPVPELLELLPPCSAGFVRKSASAAFISSVAWAVFDVDAHLIRLDLTRSVTKKYRMCVDVSGGSFTARTPPILRKQHCTLIVLVDYKSP
jgi:hypothetical protein